LVCSDGVVFPDQLMDFEIFHEIGQD
jgi:hypothetical protein